jgi:hypothetical protein
MKQGSKQEDKGKGCQKDVGIRQEGKSEYECKAE